MAVRNEHQFVVIAVDLAAEQEIDAIAIALTDAGGGRVRLHLGTDRAEQLRDRISAGWANCKAP